MIEDAVGVVLAGGMSTRMGSDKAQVEVDGRTLLDRAVHVLRSVFTTVVVSGEPGGSVTVPVIPDVVAAGGPLSGLDAAFATFPGSPIFLLAVDMPFVERETVLEVARPGVGPDAARVPRTPHRIQPLAALYGAGLGTLVRDQLTSDDRSMAALLGRVETVEYVDFDDDVFMNVNTPDDLEAAIRRSARRPRTR